MIPKPFPKNISIQLPEPLRNGLAEIAERERFEDQDALVKVMISKGIVITLASHGERMTSEAAFPYDRAGKAYRERHKKMIDEIKREDPSLADFHLADAPESSKGQLSPSPHRHVASMVSVQLPENLRRSFEDFLAAHDELDEQEALRLLLQRGLDQGEQRGRTPEDRKAAEMLHLAERLYSRSLRRCGR